MVGSRELSERVAAAIKRGLGPYLLFALLAASAPNNAETVAVQLDTHLGNITLALDLERAPVAATYFLGYVDRGQYDGATIYRAASLDGAAPGQLIQGGLLRAALTATAPVDLAAYGIEGLPVFETTGQSGLLHERGTVSLARDLLDSGDAIPEIVFYLRPAPRIDEDGMDWPDRRGYPAIGRVLEGMDVVDAIAERERAGRTTIEFLQGQILSEPVRILRARRIAVVTATDNKLE